MSDEKITIEQVQDFDVSFENANYIDVSFDQGEAFECDFETGIVPGDYSGSYVVDPDQGVQVLPTAGKMLDQNIVVNPIPSNYGLITYNGVTITVS